MQILACILAFVLHGSVVCRDTTSVSCEINCILSRTSFMGILVITPVVINTTFDKRT